eukprot:4523628-Pyramimonas_sp.AAC.1
MSYASKQDSADFEHDCAIAHGVLQPVAFSIAVWLASLTAAPLTSLTADARACWLTHTPAEWQAAAAARS